MKHSDFNRLDLIILDGAEYRVSSHDTDGIVLVGIAAPNITRSITHGELEELLRSPRFRYVAEGASRAVAERGLIGLPEHFRDLPEAKRDTALWRQLYVEELLRYVDAGLSKRNESSVNAILPAIIGAVEMAIRKRQRGPVKRAGRKEALNTPPCAKSLLTWKRDYVNSGFNIMSLVPRTHRCGNKRHMLPGERAAFDALIAEYASPLRPSIDGIHERAINLYADFNRGRAEQHLPKLQPPSRSSVYRAVRQMDPYQTYLQRHGVDAANKKFAIIEYGVQVLRPMERVEIDEWEVDLMTLVSDAGLLGEMTTQQVTAMEVTRLVICVAIDCATRCVVGLSLCRSTSSQAAIRTLEMVTTDKTAIALSLGCRAGWHQSGRPETIAADMGAAFVSDDFKITSAGLHTRIDDFPGAQEQRLIDDSGIGALGADPHLAGVHHPALLQLEGELVEDVVANVFLVGQHLMDRRPRPWPIEIGAQSIGVQDIRDFPLGSAVFDEHAIDASNNLLFVLGAGNQNDPVSLEALLLAARQLALRNAVLVDQHPAQSVSGRAALAKTEFDEAALAREDLYREFAAVFARHHTLYGLQQV